MWNTYVAYDATLLSIAIDGLQPPASNKFFQGRVGVALYLGIVKTKWILGFGTMVYLMLESRF